MEDSVLITKCLQQDRKSQKLLYERFSGQMYSICLRYCRDESDAQDALQNAFIKVFGNLNFFKGNSSLHSWIRTIVIRASLDELKKKKKEEALFIKDDTVEETEGAMDQEHMSYHEMMKLVNAMPLGYKTIFNMAVMDEMPHSEISKLLGIKESTSRSQLLKARNYLKKQMSTSQNLYI